MRPQQRSGTIVKGRSNLTPKSKNVKITLSERLELQNDPSLLKASLDMKEPQAANHRTLQPPTRIKHFVLEEEEADSKGHDSHSKIPTLRNCSKKRTDPTKPTGAVSPHLGPKQIQAAQASLTSVSINFTP